MSHWPGRANEDGSIGGGLASWQAFSGQDGNSSEAFFPTHNIYDQLDFSVEGKPYHGQGEGGADIGCTWMGKHTDRVRFGPLNHQHDRAPWMDP